MTGALRLPTALIEFLIPVTILVTGLENILVRHRERAPLRGGYRPVFAGVFGLVHGAGFANYLHSLFTGSIVVPLLGFNLGIELGQLVVLGAGRRWSWRDSIGRSASSAGPERPVGASPAGPGRLRGGGDRRRADGGRAAALVAWSPRGSRSSRWRFRRARAHPMHTAVTEVVQEDARARPRSRCGCSRTTCARALALPADAVPTDSAMARYLRGTFALADRHGRPVRLRWRAPSRPAT